MKTYGDVALKLHAFLISAVKAMIFGLLLTGGWVSAVWQLKCEEMPP
jgi:hypothetical protein